MLKDSNMSLEQRNSILTRAVDMVALNAFSDLAASVFVVQESQIYEMKSVAEITFEGFSLGYIEVGLSSLF